MKGRVCEAMAQLVSNAEGRGVQAPAWESTFAAWKG